MKTCSEYRKIARNALENNIFSNSWLFLLLVLVLECAVISIASIIPVIGSLIVLGPVAIGVCSYSLQVIRNTDKKNKFDTLIDGFRGNVVTNILVGVLTTLFVCLWSLLLVIPGIIKAISYSQAHYIALEHPEYQAIDCITESRKMMNGHKWEYFCLQLSFIGWMIVGMFCLFIGVLWVYAYIQAANAAFYEDVKKAK